MPRAASRRSDLLRSSPPAKSPAENRSMPVTLSLVEACRRWTIGRRRRRRPDGGADLRHLVERRDQAVDLAAMLGAFADREDVGIGGAHVVVDHDAAIDVEAGSAGQIDIGADADRHDHEVAGNLAAVGEPHALDARRRRGSPRSGRW